MTTVNCEELYIYLACNDTIHDFGKGADRGKNINSIVQGILQEKEYNKYTPFGTNSNITISNFERSVEEFILYNCDLPGIPESVLAQSPYLSSPNLGDSTAKDVKDVAIYRFINKNKNVNYGIKLFSYQVLGLTNIQRKNIFEEPSNIDPAISFFSTIIIEDQYEVKQIRKLFNWMEDELNESDNVTSLLPNSKDTNKRSDIKKNKIGDFLINTFFYSGEGSGYKGFIYNTDAVAGNLKCAFSGFNNNVLGGVKDTANYGDSAGTEETGGDEEDSSSKKNKVSTCGKNKKTRIGDNLFDLVVGYFNVEQKERGRLSIEVTENPDHLPSLFPATNGEPKGRKVYFFSNNFFTKENFTIAYVETENKNWKPYFQPYNFSLCIYIGAKSPQLTQQIQSNPGDPIILIGEAPFSSGDNGPSVVYLKDLIDAVDKSTDQKSFEENINAVIPEGKVLNINKLIIDIYRKLEVDHNKKKNIIIKLLLDLKRCGDYEQVDAIRMIQDQNEGTNNRFGLQDILFTTGDRLCSLYSRLKKTNVQFFVAGTQRYYLYRQPYIYPSDEVRTTILQKNIFNELKQKAKKAEIFMTNIQVLKDFNFETEYPTDPMETPPTKAPSYIKSLFTYIYLLQKDRLIQLKNIADKVDLESKIEFCQKLKDISFDQMQIDKEIPFYFEAKGTILNIKYKGNSVPGNCNQIIDSFYFLSSSEIFSEIFSEMTLDTEKTTITTIFLLDFISKKNTDEILITSELKEKLKKYYENMSGVYNLMIIAYSNIKRTGTKRASKVNVKDYLKYSNIIIAFLKLCNLIFGSLDEINGKINELENINNTLDEAIKRGVEIVGKKKAGEIVTPQSTVDVTPTSGELELSPDFEPKNTFKDIVDKLYEYKTTKKLEEKKININKTKEERKQEKQVQQKAKQKAKDLKKTKKMQRAVAKIKALNAIKGELKSKRGQNQGIENIQRISVIERKGSLRQTAYSGGAIIQKGGGVIDTLIGNKLEELYQEVNIIAFMNQIYSNIMPYELLLILLTEFDFEYSGISNKDGEMIPLSNIPDNADATNPEFYPMVLSRGEYLLKFQTELRNLISNPNIGLEDENKIMLTRFAEKQVETIAIEETEETPIEYNTEALENELTDPSFTIKNSLENMRNNVLVEKNVPCFLNKINTDSDTNRMIKDYLRDMGKTWLIILKEVSEEKTGNKDLVPNRDIIFNITESGVLPYPIDRGTAKGLTIPNDDVKASLQNIHLITTLLTIDLSEGTCSLQNPLPNDIIINNYITTLNKNLELENLCREGQLNNNNLQEIRNLITKLITYNEKIYTIIIYLLTIIGAILFDVTKPYFPCQIKKYTSTIFKTINPTSRRTGEEKTVGITNEEIFKSIHDILKNLFETDLPKKEDEIKCEELPDNKYIVDDTCVNPIEDAIKGMCLMMGGTKTKRNKKHSKNRSLRFK